jgi:PAS domain S-box-containing protein
MKTPSLDLFQLAFESSPAGKVVTDETGTILIVNAETERLFGYAREELVGQLVDRLVPERYRQRHPGYRRTFYDDPRARPMGAGRDLFGLRKDGTEIPIEIALNPVHTGDGVLILTTIIDISARRELEARLRQSQKLEAIGTLAGGIAHDFNNLLRAIVGYTELASGASTSTQVLADLDQVQRAAARGQELVLRMLAFSRPSEALRAPIALEQPVSESVNLLRASIPSMIEIRSRFEADVPSVRIDPTQVQQVVMNLVTNAAQAIGDQVGSIEVVIAPVRVDEAFAGSRANVRAGHYARISVSDSGPGMSDEVLQHALEPFFTTKSVGRGTGLGLSMVHGIAHGAGGFVELHSRPGAGTTAHVYVPAVDREMTQTASPVESPTSGPHILFVDDEQALMELSRRQLEMAGFTVTGYTSSLKALEDFRSRPGSFALVITDNTMPKMSGLQLAKEVLLLRPGMPVLLVSGLVDTLAPDVIYQRGISGLLRKPHTGAQLVAAARALTDANRPPDR